MEEVLDVLTEFLPVEALVSILAGLFVVAGGLLIVLKYAAGFTALPGPELMIGLGMITAGVILSLFSSIAGEALELLIG